LKYLVDQDTDHLDADVHGTNKYGIFFLGFRKRNTLINFLNNGLLEKITAFNQVDNVSILLFYREE